MAREITAFGPFNRYPAGAVTTTQIQTLVANHTGGYANYLEALENNTTLAVRERESGSVRTLGPVSAGFFMHGEFTEVTASDGALFIARARSWV